MSIVAAIRTMLEKGLSLEHALIAAEALEETIAPIDTRSKGAIRTEKWRERKASQSVTERHKTSQASHCDEKVSPSLSPKEKSPPITPSKEITPISTPSKTPSTPLAAGDVLKILTECLTIETATDLIAHRKALKSPMTIGSAKGLVKSFLNFGDPEAAALSMMANGWKGFKPDWMKSEARAGPLRSAQRGGAAHLLAELIEQRNDDRQEIFPTTPVKLIPQLSFERSDDGGECSRLIAGSFKGFS